MNYEEYLKLVNESKFDRTDLGKWVRFSDSFPPIGNEKTKETSTTIEVLNEIGDPVFHVVFRLEEDDEVRFRDPDFTFETLEWRRNDNLYWRFLPEPPYDCSYNAG